MPKFEWALHCREEDVRFRAACNDVVESGARPVKRRVVRRLAESAEARAIWDGLVAASPVETVGPLFQALTGDTRWKTLVIEHVDAERRWADVRQGAFKDAWDRVRSAVEKACGEGGHAIARSSALGLAGGMSLFMSYRWAGSPTLELPIKPTLSQVTVQMPKEPVPIPIKLVAADGQAIPISLLPAAADRSIRIDTTLSGDGLQPLARIAASAGRSEAGLGRVVARLDALTAQAEKLNREDGAVVKGISSLAAAVGDVQKTAADGVQKVDTLRGEMTQAGQALESRAADMTRVGMLGFQQTTVPVKLTNESPKPVELRWIGERGQVQDCVFDVSARREGGNTVVTFAQRAGCSLEPLSLTFDKPKTARHLGGLPFDVVLDGVERLPFGPRRTSLRIIRNGVAAR
jgi:hypothetical protein